MVHCLVDAGQPNLDSLVSSNKEEMQMLEEDNNLEQNPNIKTRPHDTVLRPYVVKPTYYFGKNVFRRKEEGGF